MNQNDSLLIMRQVARIEELGSQVNELTESNRQLREENAQIKAHLNLVKKHPAKCNDGLPEIVDFAEMERIEQERDQLREELEKANEQVKLWKIENESRAILIRKYHKIIGYDNSDGFHSEPSPEQIMQSLKTALAAAKEALETCRCLEPEQRQAVANALARIAECEKGT